MKMNIVVLIVIVTTTVVNGFAKNIDQYKEPPQHIKAALRGCFGGVTYHLAINTEQLIKCGVLRKCELVHPNKINISSCHKNKQNKTQNDDYTCTEINITKKNNHWSGWWTTNDCMEQVSKMQMRYIKCYKKELKKNKLFFTAKSVCNWK